MRTFLKSIDGNEFLKTTLLLKFPYFSGCYRLTSSGQYINNQIIVFSLILLLHFLLLIWIVGYEDIFLTFGNRKQYT